MAAGWRRWGHCAGSGAELGAPPAPAAFLSAPAGCAGTRLWGGGCRSPLPRPGEEAPGAARAAAPGRARLGAASGCLPAGGRTKCGRGGGRVRPLPGTRRSRDSVVRAVLPAVTRLGLCCRRRTPTSSALPVLYPLSLRLFLLLVLICFLLLIVSGVAEEGRGQGSSGSTVAYRLVWENSRNQVFSVRLRCPRPVLPAQPATGLLKVRCAGVGAVLARAGGTAPGLLGVSLLKALLTSRGNISPERFLPSLVPFIDIKVFIPVWLWLFFSVDAVVCDIMPAVDVGFLE